jgi:hypothetical protein
LFTGQGASLLILTTLKVLYPGTPFSNFYCTFYEKDHFPNCLFDVPVVYIDKRQLNGRYQWKTIRKTVRFERACIILFPLYDP